MIENNWFISDLHINHYWKNQEGQERGVIFFERTRFKNIKEHDNYVLGNLYKWANAHKGQTLWILGDLGDISIALRALLELKYSFSIKINLVMGNHDSSKDKEKFKEVFDEVYDYPVFISKRVVLSHEPLYPLPEGMINIHGHLHGAKLDSKQHICVSAHVIGYNPISWKAVSKALSKIPNASYKFLQEPYRELYQFTQPKEDVVYNNNGKIKLKESIKKYNQIYGKRIQ